MEQITHSIHTETIFNGQTSMHVKDAVHANTIIEN